MSFRLTEALFSQHLIRVIKLRSGDPGVDQPSSAFKIIRPAKDSGSDRAKAHHWPLVTLAYGHFLQAERALATVSRKTGMTSSSNQEWRFSQGPFRGDGCGSGKTSGR